MFENITLEMSLKPFKRTDDDYVREVCRKVFEDWRPLIKDRKTVSIMLWCADGSELLDWAGDLNAEFAWCEWLGTANNPTRTEDEPRGISLHKRRQPYMKNPPRMTYGILKKIVSTLKEEGKRALPEATIRVGETFDIGPEFSESDFKYRRHLEITSGTRLDKFGFVDSTAALHRDDRCYAAYPNGIPEGLIFGTFLGKQAKEFLPAMGFDYLWLSNGLGFSSNPWNKTGKIFDGENYYPEKLKITKKQVFDFWRLFREACPDIPLEVRGTNNSVGIDYATDGVPLYDIYNAGFDLVAPPNSPWAALNDNFGLEIMGHMTRVAELPNKIFPFRYYLHDPWWVNSPWYDRYDGVPSDIYLPMAISRIDENGKVGAATALNLLTIDNSFGDMPKACVNEPLPHILKAEKDAPDAIAPLVWVYPMREYTTTLDASLLREMNEGDNYIQDAINIGFPLTQVVSTDNFAMQDPHMYSTTVLISPVPVSESTRLLLEKATEYGAHVIVYGTASKLDQVNASKNLKKVDMGMGVSAITSALAEFGYSIRPKTDDPLRSPVVLFHSSDGGLFMDSYSRDTTVDVRVRFPYGAPLPLGMETKIENGESVLRLSRAEHRECRLFIDNTEDCVISVKENAPVSARFRRVIRIEGLKNATIRFFPERGFEDKVYLMPTPHKASIDHSWALLTPTVKGEIKSPHGYAEFNGLNGDYFVQVEYPEWPN